MTTFGRIQFRRDTTTQWASVNPILLDAEFGIDVDKGLFKIGDGESAWNALPYFGSTSTFAALLVWDAIDSKPPIIAAGDTPADARAAIDAVSTAELTAAVANLVGAAPETLDTIAELAAALQAADIAGIMTAIGNRQARIMTGTCGTAVGAQAKTVTLDAPWASVIPAAGDRFRITFTNGNTAADPALSINGATARAIRTPTGATSAANTTVGNGSAVDLHFDGTYLNLPGATANSTYSEIAEVNLLDEVSAVLGLMSGRRMLAAFVAERSKVASLSGKTLVKPTITWYTETRQTPTNVGSAFTFQPSLGTVIPITLTANCTFTMPAQPGANESQSFIAEVFTGAGGFTGTFTGVKWAGGSAPVLTTTAGRMDLVSFFADGTNWFGSIMQNFTP